VFPARKGLVGRIGVAGAVGGGVDDDAGRAAAATNNDTGEFEEGVSSRR